jgi:hypothetical protein
VAVAKCIGNAVTTDPFDVDAVKNCSYSSRASLSQISGVDGSSGMVVDFVTSGSEGPHDPECGC